MYWPADRMRLLLSSIGFDFNGVELIVSCDYGVSKHNGELYDVLLTKLQLNPKDIIHIGDNFYSDVQQARFKGINSFHYDLIPDKHNSCYFYEKVVLREQANKIKSLRKLAGSKADLVPEEYRFWFEFGAEVLGPFFTAFADYVADYIQQKEIQVVLPLMREGEFFSKLISNVNKEYKLDIEIEPLFVSRQATYFPALDSFHLDLLNDFFDRFKFSVGELFDFFNIELSEEHILNNYLAELLENADTIMIENKALKQHIKGYFSQSTRFIRFANFVLVNPVVNFIVSKSTFAFNNFLAISKVFSSIPSFLPSFLASFLPSILPIT
jgi:predicted HAD superfamily hydrolase